MEKTADRLGDESISPSPSQTSPASGFGALQANCEAFPADATLQVEVAELRKKITALEADRFEPPELEELQALCSTLESQRRGLEQEVQRLHGSSAELEARLASSANVQEKLQSLVEESSVLEEDLALERANHARLAAEAEGERAKTEELRRRLSELEDENAALLKMVGSQQACAQRVGCSAVSVISLRLNVLYFFQNLHFESMAHTRAGIRARTRTRVSVFGGSLHQSPPPGLLLARQTDLRYSVIWRTWKCAQTAGRARGRAQGN